MTSVDRVKAICKERKIPISRLEKDLGYANGYVSQLKKGSFPDKRLIEIAKYLQIPISEIIDEQKEKPSANGEGSVMMNPGYEFLNAENRDLIDEMIDKLLKSQSDD